jgi:hypothetical protein
MSAMRSIQRALPRQKQPDFSSLGYWPHPRPAPDRCQLRDGRPARHGTPIEPRHFNHSFNRCIAAAKVPAITVHGTRETCGSLLAALDVHPWCPRLAACIRVRLLALRGFRR